jgi:hypothetical protein
MPTHRIIIEAPGGQELQQLVNLLRRLDFVRSVRWETGEEEEVFMDPYVQPGPPMSMEVFTQRIALAEAEDQAGSSLLDEEWEPDF